MRHSFLIEPRHKSPRYARRTLILVLGLAILTALAVSGATPNTRYEGFSQPSQSLSFMPETVRLRTPE